MPRSTIIFFGRNPAIMALMQQQISALGHTVEGFLDEPEMAARLRARTADLLVLGPGVETEPRMNCRALCTELGIGLLEHEGGPDQLSLSIEVALAKRQA